MARSIFTTDKKENFKSRMNRLGFNFFPAYRRTGARILFISDDFKEVHIKLGLSWKTRNYVGSVFGGSIYGALDPIYMVQLINNLGKNFVVWDKAATIKFIKPVKGKVYARFLITEELLQEIRLKIESEKKYTINLTNTFQDASGTIYAEVVKTIYIADRVFYQDQKNNPGKKVK